MLLRFLFRATHSMNAELTRRIRALGHEGFQPHFTTLLGHIDTEGTTISTLAQRVGTSRQAVSQLVRSIEDAGIVERTPHAADGRAVVIRHTDAGRQLLLDAITVMSAIEEEYAGLLGQAKLAELKTLLAELVAASDPGGALDLA